jgi:uncharacterized repeat protein (TIGR01451 family)
MNNSTHQPVVKGLRLGLSILGGMFLLAAVFLALSNSPLAVRADPIKPPEGYPKLKLSVKTVTPTLANVGSTTLTYTIEIRNTGAWVATNTTLIDVFPRDTTYISGSAQASVPTTPTVTSDTLTWEGDVGFDSTVVVSFSVVVTESYSGIVSNTAVISQHLIAEPVTATVEMIVTDAPILTIEKTSEPAKPGANKPLTYTITVANMGQPMTGTITVTERIPLSTTVLNAGGGVTSTDGAVITWTRNVTMNLRDEEAFTFSVRVDDVLSGTVIANNYYQVDSSETDVTYGEPYTVTVVEPILHLYKSVWPDPPGSNREMTYTLELFNTGSLATGLVITDRLPDGAGSYFRYVGGGVLDSGVVSWSLPSLDTGESAEFAFTIYISDVMGISIVNSYYRACCAGNAIQAYALLEFGNISVSAKDLETIPPSTWPFPRANCLGIEYDKCYWWIGDLSFGETITFTTLDPQSTIGGDEGTPYTATIVVTDSLSNMTTEPFSSTAIGMVTHLAYLNVYKSAPSVIGRGQALTYTIDVWNSALATDEPPYPYLWEVLPISNTELITGSISHGGQVQTATIGGPGGGSLVIQVISWTLPAFGTGALMEEPRTFAVHVDDEAVSGTQIVNANYIVGWYEEDPTYVGWRRNEGRPVTTTVKEVGLIHSYKEVTPTLATMGPDNVLTYYLYIVNSSPLPLTGVTVDDHLPWWPSTYQRDAVASSGQVMSDIVSIHWTGDVDAFSTESVTFTVLVDDDYSGPVTNTAVISHPRLLDEVIVKAVAYIAIAEEPVLKITKWAQPDPVDVGGELLYTIRVTNLGLRGATGLVINDTIPNNTTYITDSATAGGQLVDDTVIWEDIPALDPGRDRTFQFRVRVGDGAEVRNDQYGVECREGVIGVGEPVITSISGGTTPVYLPVIMRSQ